MNHGVKRRRQALHQTRHHYYLNVSVEAANLSDWRIESNRIETFSPELECSTAECRCRRRRGACTSLARRRHSRGVTPSERCRHKRSGERERRPPTVGLRFEIRKIPTAVKKNKFTMLFTIIFAAHFRFLLRPLPSADAEKSL